ncbi:MAG: hypothetical protein ABWX74_16955 [Aeromicrobium sp.]
MTIERSRGSVLAVAAVVEQHYVLADIECPAAEALATAQARVTRSR